MEIAPALWTLAASTLGTSLADWFFGAVLFHEKYRAYPEVWRRPSGGPGEGKAIGAAAVVSLFTPVTFFVLASWLGFAGDARAFLLAGAIWLIGPLPLLVTNHLFMKLHILVTVGHGFGWLAKLLVCAAALAWIAR